MICAVSKWSPEKFRLSLRHCISSVQNCDSRVIFAFYSAVQICPFHMLCTDVDKSYSEKTVDLFFLKKRLTTTSLLSLNDHANALSFCTGSQNRGPLLPFDPTTVFFRLKGFREIYRFLRSLSRWSANKVWSTFFPCFERFCTNSVI